MIKGITAAHPLELAFFVLSLVMLGIAIWSLREALADEAWVMTRNLNGPLKLVSDQNIREELFRMCIGAAMIIVSSLAIFMAPPPPDYHQVPQSLVSMIGWNVVALILTTSSVFALYVKRKLKKYAQEMVTSHPKRRRDDL